MFRYFGIDRNYSQDERWTEFLRAELNDSPFQIRKAHDPNETNGSRISA